MTYRLPTSAMSWSSVFRQLETNKERLGIVDYSVSQTTLEQVHMHGTLEILYIPGTLSRLSGVYNDGNLFQVFINFAKEQFDE